MNGRDDGRITTRSWWQVLRRPEVPRQLTGMSAASGSGKRTSDWPPPQYPRAAGAARGMTERTPWRKLISSYSTSRCRLDGLCRFSLVISSGLQRCVVYCDRRGGVH